MRIMPLAFLAAMQIGVAGLPWEAAAQARVEIEWATNGVGPVGNPDVTAEVGDVLTATIYLENVGSTIAGYTIDVTYDASELSLKSATEFLYDSAPGPPPGPAFELNFNAGTGNFGVGSGLLYEAVIIASAAVPGRFPIGEAKFDVIAVTSDHLPDLVTQAAGSEPSVFDGALSDVTGSTFFQRGEVIAASDVRVEIEWATNGLGPVVNPDVGARVGDTLTATIYLENIGGSITGYTIDVTYDATELSLNSATEFLYDSAPGPPPGPAFDLNFNAGTGNFGVGSGLLFEAVTVNPGVPGRFPIGEAEFEVIAVNSDGLNDLVTQAAGSEPSVFDGALYDVTATTSFESGEVVPATFSLPMLGTWGVASLAGLVLASTLWALRRPSGASREP